jgi:hypothetical protein
MRADRPGLLKMKERHVSIAEQYLAFFDQYYFHLNAWVNRQNCHFCGSECHTAPQTIQLLQESFPGSVISRSNDQNWPSKLFFDV